MIWKKEKRGCCTSIHRMYNLTAIWLVPGAGGIFPSEIIKNVSSLSGNLLNDLRYYGKKSFGETSFFNLDYLCFYYYLLARNCTICRESWHDYSSSGLSHAFRSVVEKNKYVIHQPRSVRIGKPVPAVLSIRDLVCLMKREFVAIQKKKTILVKLFLVVMHWAFLRTMSQREPRE